MSTAKQNSILTFLSATVLLGACTGGGDSDEQLGEIRSHLYTSELEGFSVYMPEEKRGDPRAGDPDYVYLIIGQEAVKLTGPTLGDLAVSEIEGLFEFREPMIESLSNMSGESGFVVVVNERLSYMFSIGDFEDEGSVIGEGSINLVDGELRSEFVFAANGSPGVAHDITITAQIDGNPVGIPTLPVTVETRIGACTMPIGNMDFIEELIEPLRTCKEGDVCIPIAAPDGCWQGATNNGAGQELVIEIDCEAGCPLLPPLPSEAICDDGYCRLL